MGWYVAGTYAMMVFGKIITGYLADIFGRQDDVGHLRACSTAVYLPILIYSATPTNVAVSAADLRLPLRRTRTR